MNIADSLTSISRSRPTHPAIIAGERTITYRELENLVRRTAGYLKSQGADRGVIVGVAMKDTVDHIITLMALAGLGAIVLPIDCRWSQGEKERVVDYFAPGLLLLEPEAPWNSQDTLVRNGPEWADGVANMAPATEYAQGPGLPFLLSLSSGTTGMPKGPVLTHDQFIRRFWAHWINIGLNANSLFVAATPLYFGGGRTFVLSQLFSGGTVCLFPPPYTPEELVEEINVRQATAVFLVPTLLRRLLGHAPAAGCLMPTLQLLLSSGSPLHQDERRAIREKVTPNFYELYATTEGGGVSLLTPKDQNTHGASVGRPLYGVEAQIVDENNEIVEPGCTGILRYRGPGCATEFYGDPVASKEMFSNGWFYPGDLGAFDSDGYLFLRGRRNDLIIRGGINIYPNEIEEVLLRHDQVQEAAVVGIRAAEMGEEIAAFVVQRGEVGEDELIAFCRKDLAPYKIPKRIIFVDDMPRNSSGKILKRELVGSLEGRA